LISKVGVTGITNDGLLTILKQSIQNGDFTYSLNQNAEVNNVNNDLKCLVTSSAQKVEPITVASNASADDKKTSKLSPGALAGIIIAVLIVAGLVAGGIYLYTSAKTVQTNPSFNTKRDTIPKYTAEDSNTNNPIFNNGNTKNGIRSFTAHDL